MEVVVSLRDEATAVRAGALAWVCVIEYFVAEIVTAEAWRGHYRIRTNSVSALGETTCHGSICSPLHDVMNTGFIVTGVLVVAGGFALQHLVPTGRIPKLTLAILVVGGISCVLAGFVPVNVNSLLHWSVAAPTFVMRNAALALIAYLLWQRWRKFAGWTVFCFAVGTLGTFAMFVHGAPFGITERLSLYPFTVWSITAGVAVLIAGRHVVRNSAHVRR